MEHGPATVVHISSGTILKTLLWVILAVLLFLLRDIVLIVLTSIVIASAIEPAVRWFREYRIPRVVAVLLVYLAVILILFGLFYFLMPPLFADLSSFLSTL